MPEEFKVKKRITYNGGVYRLSIPKLIIDNLGLKKGDEVTIIYKDSKTLIITTKD